MKLFIGVGVTTTLCGLLASAPALANTLENKHQFRLGAFEQDIDITGRATLPNEEPLDINFDNVLGLENSSTTVFGSYRWRFTDKWALSLYYSQLRIDGEREANRDFTWNGEEFSAGLVVETEFDMDTYLADVSYSFIKDDRKEFGIGAGLHAFDVSTSIGGRLRVNEDNSESVRTSTTLLAPLPNLRGYGTIMFTPKWEGTFNGGWLSLNYEDYEGKYLYLNLLTRYWFTPRFALGLSYEIVELDIEHDDGNTNEAFDIDLHGPSLFLTYGF